MANSNSSNLAKEEQKLALKLLIPAFLILIIIALYPLGQVFYTSFTDKEFASTKETSFVGLDNYKALLSVTVKELEPIIDEGTGEQAVDDESGEKLFQRPIRVLPRDPYLYRPSFEFSVFGNKYVVGARTPDFIRSVWNYFNFHTIFSVF
ncbi:Binding-protein-dependent transport systems inner membrane component [Halanaerobium saccharolyticum subsp. saccharolyticum DSM 6643]|uniref:Binding-protein-dependent transport systems inner membrane component n=1 Tax=Halanaerobium saccharolyticum subsp. saccharolyticum DSM 6643 TaxID=1293054 RepID=M5E4G1_9FIRM|nr:sugar ABC transporter permease [Halanaerobium saccharolyticum]CCU83273.1 Binding-protein-dependent transport systems inner membrane component [Halanaerobium saccharolyticum subsp. saccharolyticum DSM 6643]